MRSPRRLSSPTTSERRRPRSEPSERPVSFRGIWTRLPSARIATATWRRLRPSNRPKVVSTECPADPGGSRSLRGVGCSRNHPGPMESRSSSSEEARAGRPQVRTRRSAIAVQNQETVGGSDGLVAPACVLAARTSLQRQRCPASRTRAELASAESISTTRKACAFSMRVMSISSSAGRRRG
jgi:hypothetical protein